MKALTIRPLVFLLTGIFILSTGLSPAFDIIGTGNDALLGGDLTDPQDDGVDDNANGLAFEATFFASAAATFNGNGGAFQVFSNSLTADNGSGNGHKYCCGQAPVTIGARFDVPYVLTHFTLSSTNDSPGRDPDVYRLQGSNDSTDGVDGNWTDIYVYDNDGGTTGLSAAGMRNFAGNTQFTARNQVLRFNGNGDDFATPAAYASFRIVMDSASGWVGLGDPADPNDALALGEFELFGIPGTGTAIRLTDFSYDMANDRFSFTWTSAPGRTYSLLWSTDLENWDADVTDSIPSGGATTTFPPAGQPAQANNPVPGAREIFFRIEENP